MKHNLFHLWSRLKTVFYLKKFFVFFQDTCSQLKICIIMLGGLLPAFMMGGNPRNRVLI